MIKYLPSYRHIIYIIFVLFFSLTIADLLISYHPSVLEQAVSKTLQLSRHSHFWWQATIVSDSVIALGIIAIGYLLYLVYQKNVAQSLLLGLSLISLLTIEPLKLLFHRDRPDVYLLSHPLNPSYGFPSGHALAATLLAGTLVFIYTRRHPLPAQNRWEVYLLPAIYALLVGWSRIALGVHYPSDVIGGYVIGLGYFLIFTSLYYLIRSRTAVTDSHD